MRASGRGNTAKQWARLALKLGVLLTDPRVWTDFSEDLSERVDDVRQDLKQKYHRTADRVEDVRGTLRGDRHWVAPAVCFLGGVAFGAGIGTLLAPTSREEARASLRNKFEDARRRVSDVAAAAVRSGAFGATGTDGD